MGAIHTTHTQHIAHVTIDDVARHNAMSLSMCWHKLYGKTVWMRCSCRFSCWLFVLVFCRDVVDLMLGTVECGVVQFFIGGQPMRQRL